MCCSVDDVTTHAVPQDGPEELEATLDEVITHLRDELDNGTWPTGEASDQR
jgi:hypothetical protein